MANPVSRASVSRREFLRNIAAGGASALVASGAPAFMPLSLMPFGPIRVGLLMPSFRTYPQVGASFLDGFHLFRRQSGAGHELQLFGGIAQSPTGLTVQAFAQLCEEARPDVVVSVANPAPAADLQPFLEERGIPLLISHAGANRVDKALPNVFYNTLGYWQASFRAGAWAAETLGRRAVVVSSFVESGYDALTAFEEGLEQEGGRVVARHVTHVSGRRLTMPDLMRQIGQEDADFVYAHHSGATGAEFIAAYTASRFTRDTPLLGSTFLLEGALPGPANGPLNGLYSVSSWTDSLRHKQNVSFLRAFRSRYGRHADSFVVLGYETAGLLSAAVALMGAGALTEGLRQAQFAGPRGVIAIGKTTGSVAPPLFLRQIVWASGGYHSIVRDAFPPVPESAIRVGVRTGWLNPYLTI